MDLKIELEKATDKLKIQAELNKEEALDLKVTITGLEKQVVVLDGRVEILEEKVNQLPTE